MAFLSRTQTQNFLADDPDGFIARLGPYDLAARHCRTRAEYKTKAINSAASFTQEEKDAIWRQAILAREFLETTRYGGIPWKFAKARYEDSLPHTRVDTIFIPGIVSARVLVHEMVHLNQKRRGPNIPHGYTLSKQKIDNLRANPDTDGRVWFKDGVPAGAFYGENPQSILDVTEVYRHPFEEEAYTIDNIFTRV